MGKKLNALENFNIDIFKLSNEKHSYQFAIDNSFFEAFSKSLIERGNGKVDVTLIKTETLIDVTFKINVTVELICDRTLETFDHKLALTKGLIIKYGDEAKELDDEIIVIPRNAQQVNLAQYIYEYIGLAIPMKKLHPKFDGEDESDELIYTSQKTDKKEDNNEAIDPRWRALKNLK